VTHPYFGPIGLRDSIVFMTVHTRHHLRNLPPPDGAVDGS
jgi:hypothetical protein